MNRSAGHLLIDQLFGENGAHLLFGYGLLGRGMQRGQRFVGHVGHDVVPLRGHLILGQAEFFRFHSLFYFSVCFVKVQKKKPAVSLSRKQRACGWSSGFNYTRTEPHSLSTRVNERRRRACMLKLRIIFFSANITGPILKSKFFGGDFPDTYIYGVAPFSVSGGRNARSEAPARFSAPISTRLTIFMYLCSILACRSGRCDGGTSRQGGDSGAAGPANAAFRRGEGGPAC